MVRGTVFLPAVASSPLRDCTASVAAAAGRGHSMASWETDHRACPTSECSHDPWHPGGVLFLSLSKELLLLLLTEFQY